MLRKVTANTRSTVPVQSIPVGDERCCSAGVFCVTVRPYHPTPLRQLHWLKAPERVEFKLAVLVYKCRQRTAPSYLFEERCQSADFEARRRLRSASSSSLVVRRTRLSTIGDRAFPVAAACIWNGLPPHVTYCTLAACFSQSSEDAPIHTLLSVTPLSVFCRACEVTCHNRTR